MGLELDKLVRLGEIPRAYRRENGCFEYADGQLAPSHFCSYDRFLLTEEALFPVMLIKIKEICEQTGACAFSLDAQKTAKGIVVGFYCHQEYVGKTANLVVPKPAEKPLTK